MGYETNLEHRFVLTGKELDVLGKVEGSIREGVVS
jgi:hypothetical protein